MYRKMIKDVFYARMEKQKKWEQKDLEFGEKSSQNEIKNL